MPADERTADGLPAEEITGDEVLLVPVPADRVDDVLAGDVRPYVAGKGWPRDDTAAALSFRAVRGMTWLIAVEGVVVGELGTKGPPDPVRGVEIGYGLAAPSRGKGVGTRAVSALLDWLLDRDDVPCVIAHVDPGNEPSVRLLRRLGFARIGNQGGEDVYELHRPPP